ncbi:aldehyde dehydrogenase family protein [Microbulbifer agarilyticus]|uniref:aldehyde dehydrogenase family protein n=1 Tax=Microbulbifer agarilyticus TaxID=260552 RepID=UPI001CD219C1|nr:aldehyde dehydrogenase family protein [Microbulbifer agarilyticus]MCA0892104.1 aldehyde dehydrogenase family protein [Microbulbifer agarilyticus]
MQNYDMLIGGAEVPSANGTTFAVTAPASDEVLGHVPRAGAKDVDDAVAAAARGFDAWFRLRPAQREAALLRAAELVAAEGEARFLDTLIDESGSTITKARGEISYTVDLLRTAAGEARRLYGETFPNDDPHRISMVFREPLGVVGVVSPYNAPLSLLTKMCAFPLAAGNSLVVKPSEETPLTALAFGRLLWDAGVPSETVNIVTGFGAECGSELVNHPGVRCIALTGSTNTGIAVGQAGLKQMRRMQLELGGKSALLVLRDADPAEAAKIAAQGIFTHSGQICMANSRIVVAKEVYEPFIAALKAEAESLHLGDLRDEKTVYGPLINGRAVEKVLEHVKEAIDGGAGLLTGGEVLQGLVVKPTVLLDPPRTSRAWREESFGPVASVVQAEDLEQAIAIANDCDYGLSAAVLTNNLQWGLHAARRIASGAVHIGMHAFQSNALAPIGGVGLSGVGRSGGHYSTEEFTEMKWISADVGSLPR